MPWNVGSLSPYKDMLLLVHRRMYVIHSNLQYLIWMLLKFGKWMFICLSRSSKPARFARPPRSCRESQRPCSAHFEGAVHGRGRSKKVPKDVTQRIWEHEEVGMWEVCLLLWDMFVVRFFRALHKIPNKLHETWENAVEPRGSHRDAACKLRWPRMDGTFFVMWSSEWLGIWSFQSWSFCHGPRIFSSDTSWCDAKFLEWEGNWFVLSGMTLPMVCARVYIVYKKTLRDLEILPWDPWWPENPTKITKSFRVDVQNFGFSQDWSLWIPLRCVQSWFVRERFLWSFRESSP